MGFETAQQADLRRGSFAVIESVTLELDRPGLGSVLDLPEEVARQVDGTVLRWSVSGLDDARVTVELSRFAGASSLIGERARAPRTTPSSPGQSAAVSIIPTGIGCTIGGFAADAAPATKLLAACVDHLITNPNAVNGSDLICAPENVVYTEGSIVDAFVEGRLELLLPRANRVGLVVGSDDGWKIDHAINVANAVRAVHGVDVVAVEVTDAPIGARCVRTPAGAYTGALEDVAPLFEACERVLERGATAIAVASTVVGLPKRAYARHFAGDAPNPVGGAEAIVSHLVSRRFDVPAAHAPLIVFRDFGLEEAIVDARSAAELISVSGLASVLIGLHRAPQASAVPGLPLRGAVALRDVLAVVAPASALGGPPVFHALRQGIPVLAVRENETVLDVTADRLGVQVVEVESYAEAAGILVALREGISLASLRRPMVALMERRPAPAAAASDPRSVHPTGRRE